MSTRANNKGLTLHQSSKQSISASQKLHEDRLSLSRLIVLIPNRGVDYNGVARRIWSLASPCQISVLYLCLANEGGTDEDDARFHLATLASMTRGDGINVETRIEPDGSWVRAIHRVWQQGDAVICLAEQRVSVGAWGHQPLSGVIECLLDVPVYVLPGLDLAERDRQREEMLKIERAAQFLSAWIVPILIASAFFVLQLWINFVTTGSTHIALLCLTGLVEVGLIGYWNSKSQ
jgi:hypothetical protein